jgi:hypothetical protein
MHVNPRQTGICVSTATVLHNIDLNLTIELVYFNIDKKTPR